jgi:hypothetical protein
MQGSWVSFKMIFPEKIEKNRLEKEYKYYTIYFWDTE